MYIVVTFLWKTPLCPVETFVHPAKAPANSPACRTELLLTSPAMSQHIPRYDQSPQGPGLTSALCYRFAEYTKVSYKLLWIIKTRHNSGYRASWRYISPFRASFWHFKKKYPQIYKKKYLQVLLACNTETSRDFFYTHYFSKWNSSKWAFIINKSYRAQHRIIDRQGEDFDVK